MGPSTKILAKHPFVFSDGGTVYSMQDFIDKVRTVSDSEFLNHVSDGRNDYATWFLHSFDDSFLSRMMRHITSKRELVDFLEEYIDLHTNDPDFNSAPQSPYEALEQRSKNLLHAQEEVLKENEREDSLLKQSRIQHTKRSMPSKHTSSNSSHIEHTPINEHNSQEYQRPLPNPPVRDHPSEYQYPSQSHEVPVARPSPASLSIPAEHQEYAPKQDAVSSPYHAPTHNPVNKDPHDEYKPHVEKDSFVQSHQEDVSHPQLQFPHPKGPEYKPQASPKTGFENDKLSPEIVTEYASIFKKMREEIAKVFIGQEHTVHMVLIALVCEAHVLLEGVPGLAKSVLVEVLAKTIKGTKYSRIQFLPDLLPSDVVGGQIYNPKTNEFKTIKGPIFANFVLADEVNRAPPKTHAALMEAMAERKINIDKEEFILDRPFLVMATQNPLENKGTYALPEAVLDRFMFKVDLEYPKREHELIIIERNNNTNPELRKTVEFAATKEKIMEMQQNVKKVHLSTKIKNYILDIIEATRGDNKDIEGIKFVKYGAGPRASIALGIGAKAQSLMAGRNYVLPEDVQTVAKSILRHRVSLNFKGKAYNISSDKIVEEILSKVKIV